MFGWIKSKLFTCLQLFAFKHKPQTFSRVFLRLKRGVYRWKRTFFTAHVTCYVQCKAFSYFFMSWCAFVHVSVFPNTRYCKSDQTLFTFILFVTRTYYRGLGNIETCTEAHQSMTVAPKMGPTKECPGMPGNAREHSWMPGNARELGKNARGKLR
jgi:hypothetical protein